MYVSRYERFQERLRKNSWSSSASFLICSANTLTATVAPHGEYEWANARLFSIDHVLRLDLLEVGKESRSYVVSAFHRVPERYKE